MKSAKRPAKKSGAKRSNNRRTRRPAANNRRRAEQKVRAGVDPSELKPGDAPPSIRGDLFNVVRGVLMGAADVVPGVSGGTVALVLGIYTRLVLAITRFNLTFIHLLLARQWRQAARHADLRFVVSLGLGVFTGIACMALLIDRLMSNATTRSLTFAAFFGMILASSLLVAKMIQAPRNRDKVLAVLAGATGAAASYGLTLVTPSSGEPSLVYLFFTGSIAICAMILPGISGSMILLLLGVYAHVAHVPHRLLHGEDIAGCFLTAAFFGAGCLLGLLTFSRLLRWLLAHHENKTLAVLCGFMFGALPLLWPFQRDTTPGVEKLKEKVFVAYLPGLFEPLTLMALGVGVAALAAILAIDYFGKKLQTA